MKISWRGPDCSTLKQHISYSLWELRGRTFHNAERIRLDSDQVQPGTYDEFVMWDDDGSEIFFIPMEPFKIAKGDNIVIEKGMLKLESIQFSSGKAIVGEFLA